ncbi:cadherin-20 [Cricetulus griseus]|uniref:Cadherin-20 n=1 Tax=Cricetulus griseus TaxID=10029 RepID=A0A061I0D7_CRIGR|nr:cadherin-20 [Cricetulus griseus]
MAEFRSLLVLLILSMRRHRKQPYIIDDDENIHENIFCGIVQCHLDLTAWTQQDDGKAEDEGLIVFVSPAVAIPTTTAV